MEKDVARRRLPARRRIFPMGLPDLSGLWLGGGSNSGDITKGLKPGEEVVMLPWAEALMKTRKSQDDPQANCLPFGVPRGAPYPWRMVQTPTHKAATHIFILYEGNIHSYRQIFMNGASIPTIRIPPGTGIRSDTGKARRWSWIRWASTTSSGSIIWVIRIPRQLHTMERYTRTDLGTMHIEVTINDPGAYAKPFTTQGTRRLQPPGDEILEYICQENNIDLVHVNAPAQLP